ncbi:unnamed protein product [Rhizoctonia solani]|uniref:Uncharacterized protein n=1 Tax=Rhizoctonia solani TaxID=456999 RepID=A0A8H3GDC2_9AGAM|nr:unnamed protein product [Rhizoctonia solani]
MHSTTTPRAGRLFHFGVLTTQALLTESNTQNFYTRRAWRCSRVTKKTPHAVREVPRSIRLFMYLLWY